ncbi:hypothetical protein AMTR_s00085p00037620 [Amborella trichopoda]|uniref:Uncharacterized protein n=1 Tax=Amborella trichopoda TaxID=13333 RepID=W1P4X8_AMBTC|nr:hypothetical protein AMTR_s00085p00037620 [Amborella trichopoda]
MEGETRFKLMERLQKMINKHTRKIEVTKKPVEKGESTKRLREQVSDLLSKIETLESENKGQRKLIASLRDAEGAVKARLEELLREMN